MKDTARQSLIDMGLSDREAGVYLACLSLGPTTALKIARASDIKRSTVYLSLESLIAKGLITIRVKGFKHQYVAENPERLRLMIDERKQQLLQTLPSLKALFTSGGDASDIRYYEGLPAVKSVYESLLMAVKPKDDYLIISDMSQWLALDREYFEKFTERRAKLPIKIRLLLVPNQAAVHYLKQERRYNFSIKLLPPRTHLTTNLVIIPSKLVIHQLIVPIHAVVIENRSMIQMHREIYELLWNSR